jgi:hypothetical protein
VRKSVTVNASAARAFEVFTAGIDRWWPKTHGIGEAAVLESIIEPFVGGRWYTKHADGKDVVVGHVRAWDPPRRFVVGWEISANWKPDSRVAFASEVEVQFVAQTADTTRVDVEHRDFERMGSAEGATMRSSVDGGWPTILALFAQEAGKSQTI